MGPGNEVGYPSGLFRLLSITGLPVNKPNVIQKAVLFNTETNSGPILVRAWLTHILDLNLAP